MEILLIEDHPLYRQAVKSELMRCFNNQLNIVEADSLSEAFAALSQKKDFDLILYDLKLPDSDGLRGLLSITQISASPVVVVSENENTDIMQAAIDAGARAYVHKSQNAEVMKSAITLALNGETYLPSALMRKKPKGAYFDVLDIPLTNRQNDVLQLMAKGCSNKEIASELSVAETTVRVHVTEILRKLSSNNRTGAVVKARDLGLLNITH